MKSYKSYIFVFIYFSFLGLQSFMEKTFSFEPVIINSGKVNIKIHLNQKDDPSKARFQIRDYVYLKNRNERLYMSDTITQLDSKIIRNVILDLTFQNIRVPKYVAIEYNIRKIRWQGNFLFEAGDSIEVSMTSNGPIFKGRNAQKYQCQSETYKIINQIPSDNGLSASQYIELLNAAGDSCFKILETFRKYLPDLTYYTFKADIISNLQYRRNYYTQYISGKEMAKVSQFPNEVWNDKIRIELMGFKALENSITWCEFNLQQYLFDSCDLKDKRVSALKAYNYIAKNFEGLGREWLISELLTRYRFKIEDNDKIQFCVNDAISSGYIITDSTKAEILSLARTFSVGASVYNFKLSNIDGKVVRLSDFRGNLVLLDFYCYHCGACRATHPIIDSVKKKFAGKKFEIISIYYPSPNYGRESWASFVEKETYSSRSDINLIDDNLFGGKGDVTSTLQVTGFPTLILVDKNGKRLFNPANPLVDKGKSLCNLIRENL